MKIKDPYFKDIVNLFDDTFGLCKKVEGVEDKRTLGKIRKIQKLLKNNGSKKTKVDRIYSFTLGRIISFKTRTKVDLDLLNSLGDEIGKIIGFDGDKAQFYWRTGEIRGMFFKRKIEEKDLEEITLEKKCLTATATRINEDGIKNTSITSGDFKVGKRIKFFDDRNYKRGKTYTILDKFEGELSCGKKIEFVTLDDKFFIHGKTTGTNFFPVLSSFFYKVIQV